MTEVMVKVSSESAVAASPAGRRGSYGLWFNSCARQRWRILAKAIQLQRQRMASSSARKRRSDSETVPNGEENTDIKEEIMDVMRITEDESILSSSVRRFGGLNLIKCRSMDQEEGSLKDLLRDLCGYADNWFTYELQLHNTKFSLRIHHNMDMASVTELMGFNNTGNICLWPSEEALTVYCLENQEMFRNKSVLELGGGMACLAGVFIAKYCHPHLVHLTDGNAKCVDNVKMIVRLNALESECFLKTSVLKWPADDEEEEEGVMLGSSEPATHQRYDFIICADCLFFDETRESLILTIDRLLNEVTGQALVMAPRRGNTFQKFVDGCGSRGFRVSVVEEYSQEVWRRFLELKGQKGGEYDEDIHYPVLIVLTRGKD